MLGAIVVDKPEGWTSHDVVNRMRRLAGTRSVGHLGTLDPLATGVLPLLLGDATRLARFHGAAEKVYEAVVRFGFATSSYDREGEPLGPVSPVNFDAAALESALAAFRGKLQQMPPPVSAKKIRGVAAYKMPRAEAQAALQPVPVEVFELARLWLADSRAGLRVHCSAGTYVRSIAHDLGVALGCGAHVEQLRRTRSGAFVIEQARTLEELQFLREEDRFEEALLRPADLLPEIPSAYVDLDTAGQIRNGRDFRVSPFRQDAGSRFVKALGAQDELLAIGEAVLPNLYHPVVVFPGLR